MTAGGIMNSIINNKMHHQKTTTKITTTIMKEYFPIEFQTNRKLSRSFVWSELGSDRAAACLTRHVLWRCLAIGCEGHYCLCKAVFFQFFVFVFCVLKFSFSYLKINNMINKIIIKIVHFSDSFKLLSPSTTYLQFLVISNAQKPRQFFFHFAYAII